jgi:lambda family phage portal protein
MRDVDDYDFAEGIRKKIEASTVGIVTTDEETEEGVAPKITDARGNPVEKFSPGMFAYARGGKDIKFNQPATVGGYEEYKRVSAREIAAGYRQPYELLTGDLSTVNFSSARVGLVAYRRLVSQIQWQIIIPMLLEPWWNWFCEAAWLAGEIDSPDIPVEWSPPRWQAIEPYKDALADLITIRTGTRSYQDVTAERGRNPDDVLTEIAAFNSEVDALSITLDSDPRRTTMKGALQALGQEPGNTDGQGTGPTN